MDDGEPPIRKLQTATTFITSYDNKIVLKTYLYDESKQSLMNFYTGRVETSMI